MLAAAFAAMALVRPAQGGAVRQFIIINSLAFVVYLAAVGWLRRSFPPTGLLWGGALIFRMALIFTPPGLSDDVYRYVWDGHIAAHGVNPYAYRVDSPALDALTVPARAQVNNAWMASPYLPAAQLVFAAANLIAPGSVRGLQMLMVGFDLVAGALIVGLLRAVNAEARWALVYLWNPLVIVEFAHGAHVDALMIALALAALYILVVARDRAYGQALSGGLLALATLTKGLPALLLVSVWRVWRRPAWIVFIAAGGALALPYVLGAGLGLAGGRAGTGLFGAIRIYAYRWNYNGGIYHWLETWLARVPSEGALPPDTPGVAMAKISVVVAVLAVAVFVGVAQRGRRMDPTPVALRWLRWAWAPFAAYLLLATTVHPWYVTLLAPGIVFWLLPASAARNRIGSWQIAGYGFLLWTWSVTLSYMTYEDLSRLRETNLVRGVEYAPVYVILAAALGRAIWAARSRRDSGVVAE